MPMDATEDFWRNCVECASWILTNDAITPDALCTKCLSKKPSFDQWAAGVKPGDFVYLQPYCAIDGLGHSKHIVIERDGDMLTVQRLGYTTQRVQVSIGNCGPRDMTPVPRYSMW